jgi:CRP-like cAMP-binding protein
LTQSFDESVWANVEVGTGMHVRLLDPLRNQLLAALPPPDFALIAKHLAIASMPTGHILSEAGDTVHHVYFPLKGMLSLFSVLRDGKAIETATIGREGVVNGMAWWGVLKSDVRVVVEIPVDLAIISASHFRNAAVRSAGIQKICINYNEVLLTEARVTAVCNAVHSVEERFCRLLLQCSDRAESNTIDLTHELLAEMLGVRRTSITQVAQKIQSTGAIRYSRGVIEIRNRPLLLKLSCECHQIIADKAAALDFTAAASGAPSASAEGDVR